jgi:hypothetical protein
MVNVTAAVAVVAVVNAAAVIPTRAFISPSVLSYTLHEFDLSVKAHAPFWNSQNFSDASLDFGRWQ